MKRVLLIYTGGTIGMIANESTGALEAFDFEHLRSYVPEMDRLHHHIDAVTFTPPIDSSDMTPKHWVELAHIVADNHDDYDGFVVLHGTDTMAFTASALSFMLEGLQKPVIFTGSQLPIGQLRTDGKENLLTAIEIAADGKVNEVCIYFENCLMRGNRATKINAEGFNAFRSHNFPELAKAGIHIIYNKEVDPVNKPPFKPHFLLDPNINVLTIFPGIPECTVEAVANTPGLRAVILRTFGSGNAPTAPWLIKQLCRMQERGIVVVNITQCDMGSVEMGRYQTSRQLLEAGVIPGYDSTWEAMLTKLMFLLGHNYTREEIVKRMNESLAGEITI